MAPSDPHLFQLFWGLRHTVGLDLRLDDYELLVDAWDAGLQPSDYLELQSLCRRLWTRSLEEQARFDQYFELYFSQYIPLKPVTENPETVESVRPLLKVTSDSELEFEAKQSSEPDQRFDEDTIKSEDKEQLRQTNQQVEESKKEAKRIESKKEAKRIESKKEAKRIEGTEEQSQADPQDDSTFSSFTSHGSRSSFSRNSELSSKDFQIGQAVARHSPESERFSVGPFTLNDEYFRPLTRRQLQQGWRGMRNVIKQGDSEQLDILETVNQISQQGILLEPCHLPKESNCTEILLLVDRSNSMAPFDLLSERLISTAQQSLVSRYLQAFYHCSFRNYPVDNLYSDPDLQQTVPLTSVLNCLNSHHTIALIFSDAGAARGGFNPERCRKTKLFIEMLRDRVRQLAWLNPLSSKHWQLGTAKLIAQEVPMIEFDLVGWHGLIKDIRGQLVPALTPTSAQPTSSQDKRVGVTDTFSFAKQKERILKSTQFLDRLDQQLSQLIRESSDSSSYEDSKQQILEFVREFPDSLDLICHSAFPLSLTPDLFYYLRENFQPDTPWQRVPEFLLSSLCHSVGYQLYELDNKVRHLLLKLLVRNPLLESNRFYELSDSVLFYIEHRLDNTLYAANDFGEKPEWIALAYTEPNQLAHQLAHRLEKTYHEGKASQMQLASLVTSFSEPLKEAKFEFLLSLIIGRGRLARGDKRGARQILNQIPTDWITVADDIQLQVPRQFDSSPLKFPKPQTRSLQVLQIIIANFPLLKEITFEYATLEQHNSSWDIVYHPAQYHQYIELLTDNVGLEMIYVPAELFKIDEGSGTQVGTVPAFFMSKYTITQSQWKIVADMELGYEDLRANPSEFDSDDDLPVECVSWNEAIEFCARLSAYTNRNYRLPSEAEWEYACRAGTTTPFHFGEIITTKIVNYNAFDGSDVSKGNYKGTTIPVGSLSVPNEFGIHDMHGNVWEWCEDEYSSSCHILRGGSWAEIEDRCHAESYDYNHPDWRDVDIGFRVVVSAPSDLLSHEARLSES